jgi:hypothetical protein
LGFYTVLWPDFPGGSSVKANPFLPTSFVKILFKYPYKKCVLIVAYSAAGWMQAESKVRSIADREIVNGQKRIGDSLQEQG